MSAVAAPYSASALPHRKPLPSAVNYSTQSATDVYTRQPTHSHTRTSSSSAMPTLTASTPYRDPHQSFNHPIPMPPQQNREIPQQQSARRTLSNATSSTSSSNVNLARVSTNTNSYASSIRRSTSSRSTAPTSYVALMRKQKATVWCDRAQHEDPRLLAQQRAAKMRATMEVVGGNNAARASSNGSGGGITGGVRSKIRHHGAVKASAYTAANLSGAGVPMRLSASEVDEDNSDDEGAAQRYHQRNGSGRSSLGSGHRGVSYISNNSGLHVSNQGGRFSTASTPPSAASYSPIDEGRAQSTGSIDPEETPMPDMYASQGDYFEQPGGQGNSGGSGSSGEEARFGNASGLPRRSGGPQDFEAKQKTSEELRRRGSVDDRTMTMSGVRLFVANPDLSD